MQCRQVPARPLSATYSAFCNFHPILSTTTVSKHSKKCGTVVRAAAPHVDQLRPQVSPRKELECVFVPLYRAISSATKAVPARYLIFLRYLDTMHP